MSTITLSNQNQEETTSFTYGNCGFSRVFLNGLKEGELLVSQNPFLIQNTNGIIAGIDQRFTTFNILKDNQIIDTIQVNWSDGCVSENSLNLLSTNSALIPKPLLEMIGLPTLLVILSLSFAYLVFRTRK